MTIFEELFSVSGKTALVTGGASGIGRMIATALVRGGARVLICSRNGEECERIAAELTTLPGARQVGGSASGFAGNIANEAGIDRLAEAIKGQTDALHILVNNAGTSWGTPLGEFPYSAWARVLDTNVAGLFHLTQKLLPLLEAAGTSEDPARIINIGSVMGSVPLGERVYSYAASKAAVNHLTKILAKELAPRHITCNAFAPGPFQSKMTAFATGTPEGVDRIGSANPLGRIGQPDDIAGATLYICGKAGAYVSGAILPIDGGIHVQTGPDLFGE